MSAQRSTVSALCLAGLLSSLAGCSCDEEAGLQGRAPNLLLTARLQDQEPYSLLPGPKVIDFGLLPLGDERLAQVELVNDGSAALVLDAPPSLAIGTSFELREVLTTACAGREPSPSTTELQPGECAALLVVFRPGLVGAASDELLIATNAANGGALRVPLVAEGAEGGLQICAAGSCARPGEELTVDFGSQALGATAEEAVTVKNLGGLELAVHAYVLTGSPEFGVVAGPEALHLAPSSELGYTASFSPVVGGNRAAELTFTADGADERPIVVHLRGSGNAPAICVAPFPTLDFGEVIERTSSTLPVRIGSCGTLPLTLSDAALLTNGEYALAGAAPATPLVLQPGEELEIPITFTPPSAGSTPFPGRLRLGSDAPGSETITVTLTGLGVPPELCDLRAQNASLDFGQSLVGQPKRADVIFQNLGAAPCSLTAASIAATAGQGGLFRVVGMPPMPHDVGALGSATALLRIAVEYIPVDATAPDDAILAVTPAGSPAAEVALRGTPLDPAQFPCLLSAAPAFVQFGLQAVGHTGSQTVLLTNVGTEDCNVTAAAITVGQNSFTAASGVLPLFGSPVPVGDSFAVQVGFRPQAEGNAAGNLRVSYAEGFGGAALTVDVPLAGEGRAPSLCVNPASVDFGNVPSGTQAQRDVTLLNCGGVDVYLRGLQLRAGGHPGFTFTAPALPRTLTPGQSLTVPVQAASTGAGAMFGVLEVLSDDVDSPTTAVPLRANSAGCDRALVCNPAPLDFGRVEVGVELVRAMVCQNPGSVDVAIAASVPAPFSIASAPAVIRAGSAGAIAVRYTPTAVGPSSATIALGANSCAGGALTVAASGQGIQLNIPACIAPTTFSPETVWEWTGGGNTPASKQVWASPLVSRLGDTDGDGHLTSSDMPRVVVVSFNHREWDSMNAPGGPVPGIVRALDGATGAEIFSVTDPALRVNSSVTPAISDIDADGFPEIITQALVVLPGSSPMPGAPAINGKFIRGNLIAFDHLGRLKWISAEWTRPDTEIEDMGAIAVGDTDGDGFAEIAVGDHLFDHHGNLRWRGGRGNGGAGHGPMSVLADVDGQPGLELVAGRTVYRANGTILWDRPDLPDGHPAVADVNGDGRDEVVLRSGELYVLNGATGATLAGPLLPPLDMSQGRECTPGTDPNGDPIDCYPIPTNPGLIDLDGDGSPEIVVSNTNVLLAYDAQLNELWRAPVSDQTGASGPSGFDFEGDGPVESIYSDEGNVFLHDATGQQTFVASHQSVTLFETAVAADTDNDGHANLVVISNEPMFGSSSGVKVLRNTGSSWVHARGIWNQHAYVERLVGELGTPVGGSGSVGPLDGFRTATPACR